MSDVSNGPGWWMASDGKWYPPDVHPAVVQDRTTVTGVPHGPSPMVTTIEPGPSFPVAGRRRRRRPVLVTVVSVVVVALIATVAVETHGTGTSADAAVIQAVDTAIAGKTATISASGSIETGGQTATYTGSGAVDFTNSALSLDLSVADAGHQVNEQAIYMAGVIYEALPQIAQVAAGKSWISLDLSSLTKAADQGDGGLGGNPLAMLHALALQGNSVADLGATMLDGQSVHEYSVTLNPAVVQKEVDSASLPSWLKQSLSQVTVHEGSEKVYVDDAGQLAGTTFALDETAGSAGTVTLNESLAFSDYGTPVTITAPPSDQVISLSQLENLAG